MKKRRGQRYTNSEKAEILSQYESSGLGINQWCKANQYNKGTLRSWLKQRNKLADRHQSIPTPHESVSGFASVSVEKQEAASTPLSLTICYPSQVQVKLEGSLDVALVKELINLSTDV